MTETLTIAAGSFKRLTSDIVDPASSTLEKYVMEQENDVHCFEEEEKLPDRCFEFRTIEHPDCLNKLARLDGNAGTDRKPAKDVGSRTAVTLHK